MRYFLMMVETKGSLSQILLSDSIFTFLLLYYWKHKILYALRSLGNTTIQGIVESDEMYILESDQGKKGGSKHRKPRKRDSTTQKRGISDEQISVESHLTVMVRLSQAKTKMISYRSGLL